MLNASRFFCIDCQAKVRYGAVAYCKGKVRRDVLKCIQAKRIYTKVMH